jgi:hypothetical protein
MTIVFFRAMWIRLDVVRMFIEHTCPPRQSTHPADAQNGFLLWKVKPFFIRNIFQVFRNNWMPTHVI